MGKVKGLDEVTLFPFSLLLPMQCRTLYSTPRFFLKAFSCHFYILSFYLILWISGDGEKRKERLLSVEKGSIVFGS